MVVLVIKRQFSYQILQICGINAADDYTFRFLQHENYDNNIIDSHMYLIKMRFALSIFHVWRSSLVIQRGVPLYNKKYRLYHIYNHNHTVQRTCIADIYTAHHKQFDKRPKQCHLKTNLYTYRERSIPPNNTKDRSLSEEALDHLSDLLMVTFKPLFCRELGLIEILFLFEKPSLE